MKASIAHKREEQDKLLMEIFITGTTETEIQNGYLNYELIKNSLLVLKSKSLMKRKNGLGRDLDNLLEASIIQRIELGIIPKTKICVTEVIDAMYSYQIKYRKSKGAGGKKRIHNDSRSVVANSEESALSTLKSKLVDLGEELIEVLDISRDIHSIITNTGEHWPYYRVEIVPEVCDQVP